MKQLLTITALLFSVTLFSQESKLIIKSEGMKIFDVKSSNYQFWDGYNEIAKIKSSGQDTLEITYPALIKNKHLFKYIKVGDKVFQEAESTIKWLQYPSGTIFPAKIHNTIGQSDSLTTIKEFNRMIHVDTSYLIKRYKTNDTKRESKRTRK